MPLLKLLHLYPLFLHLQLLAPHGGLQQPEGLLHAAAHREVALLHGEDPALN